MAIAKMSHIRLIGLRREQNKIMDALVKRGLFEARATEPVSYELQSGGSGPYRELKLKQGKIAFALDFLKGRHAEMSAAIEENNKKKEGRDPALDFSLPSVKYTGKTLITRADFSDAAAKEFDLLHICDELERISFDIVDCRARAGAIKNTIAAYEPYAVSPLKLSQLKREGDIALDMYYNKNSSDTLAVLDSLMCAYDVINSNGTLVVTVCRASVRSEVHKQLTALGFTRCPFDDDCTAAQKIEGLRQELEDIKRNIFELTRSALAYEKYVPELRILYDVTESNIERAEAEESFLKTDSAFILEGWLPEAVAETTVAEVRLECPGVFIQLLAPEERDAPPTMLINKEIIKPYEDVTNMYTVPKYGEIDPNPVMSVFYFLFFGIMVGDAVYGLLMAVVGFILGRSTRFEKGAKRLLLLVGWGGVSAVIWGILFGGYVSVDFGSKKVALWFNPMNEPLTLLILSIVLGCVQLVAGYIMKLISQCREGEPLSAVLDNGPIILIFAAAACLGLNIALEKPPAGLTTAAIVLGSIAVATMLIFGGRKSKGIGKVLGGFGEIYGLINIVSDVLSYCRLFGLCLASAAIGLAFNTLGTIIFGIPVIGYPIGIVLLVPLHIFNLALGVLSAYVHDARLQYLEFYGKFYYGGGRLFAPIGNRSKYTRFA